MSSLRVTSLSTADSKVFVGGCLPVSGVSRARLAHVTPTLRPLPLLTYLPYLLRPKNVSMGRLGGPTFGAANTTGNYLAPISAD